MGRGIGDSAFYNCWQLSSLTISNGVASVGDHAFAWCGGVSNIVLPDSITHLGSGAFQGCGLVQEFELKGSEPGDFFGCDAPAEINAAAHDAGVGAGCVEENAIEVRRERCEGGGWFA